MEFERNIEQDGPSSHRQALRFAALTLVFLFVFTHTQIQGQNDLSRFAGVESLAVRGVFHVDDSPWAQRIVQVGGHRFHAMIDLVYNECAGHFYSSKPPVLTIIVAGVLKALRLFAPDLRLEAADNSLAVFLLTWLVIGSTSSLAFYAFRRKAGAFLEDGAADLATVLALGGTLFLAYSTTMNHHTFTATMILLAFFLLGMAEASREVPAAHVLAAGLLTGLAAVVDVGHGFIFSIAFGLYILFYLRSFSALVWFGIGSIPPLALHCVVQYRIWGSVLPVQMIPGTRDYALSYWRCRIGPDAWDIPRTYYWLLTLFSTRGLFVLSPVLLFGVAGIAGAVGGAWGRPDTEEEPGAAPAYPALTVVFAAGFLFIYYSFLANTNFCGACFGFRWYIGFTPLLAFYAVRCYARNRGRAWVRRAFYVLGLVSLMYALIGMQDQWTLMEMNPHPAVQALGLLRGF